MSAAYYFVLVPKQCGYLVSSLHFDEHVTICQTVVNHSSASPSRPVSRYLYILSLSTKWYIFGAKPRVVAGAAMTTPYREATALAPLAHACTSQG